MTKDNINREVCSFFGYAVRKVLSNYEKKEQAFLSDDFENTFSERTPYTNQVYFLKNMRYSHKEALSNKDYLMNCYSPYDQINNLGGKCLISPVYYNFAKSLLAAVRKHMNEKNLKVERNKIILKTKDKIKNDDTLFKEFISCSEQQFNIADNERLKIYNSLLECTINARSGVVTNAYNQKHSGQYNEKSSNTSLRTNLKGISKKESVKKAHLLEKKIKNC